MADLTEATELEVCRWRAKATSQAAAGATLVNHDTALPAGITGNFTISFVNPDGTGAEAYVPAGAASASTLGSTTDSAKYLCWLPRTGSDLTGDPTNGIVIAVNAIIRIDVGVPMMWQFMKAILGTLAVGLKLKSRPTFGSSGHLAKSVYANNTARNAAIPSPQNGDGPVHNTAEGADQNYIGGAWVNEESGATENMSETVAGKAEAATLAEQGAHTETGDTGALVVLQSKNTIKTPATYTPGYLTCGAAGESNFAIWNDVVDASIRIPIDGTTYNVDGIDFTGAGDMDAVMVILQAAIRAATGGQEVVAWDTDHAILTSGSTESTSAILVLTTSTGTVGTDISGAGAANWLDGDTGQGTPTAAVLDQTADENKVVVLDSNGTIAPTIVPKSTNAELAAGVSDVKFPTIAGVVHLLGNLVNTVHTYFVNTRAAKTTPVDADSVMICDSADSNKDKKSTLTQLRGSLLATNAGQGTRNGEDATGIVNIAHGLGRVPKKILFFAAPSVDTTASSSNGAVDDDRNSMCTASFPGSIGQNRSTECIFVSEPGGDYQKASVSAWDATNFTLSWTKGANGSAVVFTWIALG